MTRLIDAEKLKKHYAWWEDDERRHLFDQIVDAQPTVDAEPQWIPMTERKPDFPKHSLWGDKRAKPEYAKRYGPFEDKYLVCTDKGNIYVANWYATADGEPFWYGKCKGANIVAWMPLPEPYGVNHE